MFAEVASHPASDAAWSDLYVALWPYLTDWTIARYGLDPATTADVLQNALLEYRAKLAGGAIDRPSLAHVRGFVRLGALTALRARSRLVALEELEREPADRDAEASLARSLMIDQALDRLDPRCAYALRARYYYGRSSAEIAARLGLDAGAVDVLMHRCRARCRELVLKGSEARR